MWFANGGVGMKSKSIPSHKFQSWNVTEHESVLESFYFLFILALSFELNTYLKVRCMTQGRYDNRQLYDNRSVVNLIEHTKEALA